MKSLTQRTGPAATSIDGVPQFQQVPPLVLTYSVVGSLAVLTGTSRQPIIGGTYSIDSVMAMVGTAPAGASVIVDVVKNGTTIYGTQANRPAIAAGSSSATGGTASTTSVTTGDYLTVDIDQVGSSTPGADLTVAVSLKRTA